MSGKGNGHELSQKINFVTQKCRQLVFYYLCEKVHEVEI